MTNIQRDLEHRFLTRSCVDRLGLGRRSTLSRGVLHHQQKQAHDPEMQVSHRSLKDQNAALIADRLCAQTRKEAPTK
ncbi:MAG: hypothetical protein ACRYF2_19295 [Janthinobacterium lividum]